MSCCMQMRGLTPRVFEHLFQRIAALDEEAVSTFSSYLHSSASIPCKWAQSGIRPSAGTQIGMPQLS